MSGGHESGSERGPDAGERADGPNDEPDDGPDDEPGGDPVCWLDRLCPECGAMPTEPSGAERADEPPRCWRCGTQTT
jgi:hypothetical protein